MNEPTSASTELLKNVGRNPWLDIPLEDYEGHMSLPEIAQAQLLSDVFAGVLERFKPRSLAVLGCAGGNGFERINTEVTSRVVGVDINPNFLQSLAVRFNEKLSGLELLAGDVQSDTFNVPPVELVYAALVFEYLDPEAALSKIRTMLNEQGILISVVQLMNAAIPEVTPSPYKSLQALSTAIHLIDPHNLEKIARRTGYAAGEKWTVVSAGGKQFCVQIFSRSASLPLTLT
jgi:ubiquinone/menaquinone biosynthesis C-methylase UbiE